MASISQVIWDREARSEADHELPTALYMGTIAILVALGILASALTAYHCQAVKMNLLYIILILVVCIAGIFIAIASDNPFISHVGYALVVFPMGVASGEIFTQFEYGSVIRILVISSTITLVLGIIGAAWPGSLEHWGIWLFAGLNILIIGQFATAICGWMGMDVSGAMTLLDWCGVFLFNGYILFDMNRAMRIKRTWDNAVDVSLAVWLDWVNLFIRLLELFGERK